MSDLARLWAELAPVQGQVLAVVACWAVLTFSSLSEAALVRMEVGRARQLAEERGWAARRLLELVEGRQEVLSTLILLINVSVIAASAYTTAIAIRLSGDGGRQIAWASLGMRVASHPHQTGVDMLPAAFERLTSATSTTHADGSPARQTR